MMGDLPSSASDLFSHVTATNASLYRAILEVFTATRRQFQLQLRLMSAGRWDGSPPTADEFRSCGSIAPKSNRRWRIASDAEYVVNVTRVMVDTEGGARQHAAHNAYWYVAHHFYNRMPAAS